MGFKCKVSAVWLMVANLLMARVILVITMVPPHTPTHGPNRTATVAMMPRPQSTSFVHARLQRRGPQRRKLQRRRLQRRQFQRRKLQRRKLQRRHRLHQLDLPSSSPEVLERCCWIFVRAPPGTILGFLQEVASILQFVLMLVSVHCADIIYTYP